MVIIKESVPLIKDCTNQNNNNSANEIEIRILQNSGNVMYCKWIRVIEGVSWRHAHTFAISWYG